MSQAITFEFKKLRVLLVEDDQFLRELTERLLRELGVRSVVSAVDGEDGFQRVTHARYPFDIIVCDLEMPHMNGFQFIRQLRSTNEIVNPDVPVLILSGKTDEESIHTAVELGIHGFLAKPVAKATPEKRIKLALTGPEVDPSILQ